VRGVLSQSDFQRGLLLAEGQRRVAERPREAGKGRKLYVALACEQDGRRVLNIIQKYQDALGWNWLRASEQRLLDSQMARVTRMTTLGELTASIAHEVNQPLTAVVANAEAYLSWLNRETPDLDAACRSWNASSTTAIGRVG
jgi:C4-dicarboxylate-specific signal transduction histidine kinase